MNKKRLHKVLILLALLEAACSGPFDHDDVKEYRVVGNYFVSSINGINALLYKDARSSNLPGSGSIILDSLDSIGWKSRLIVGTNKNEYIIIDTAFKKMVKKCSDYESFEVAKRQFGIDAIIMQKIKGSQSK